jgi:hypothetical protein
MLCSHLGPTVLPTGLFSTRVVLFRGELDSILQWRHLAGSTRIPAASMAAVRFR